MTDEQLTRNLDICRQYMEGDTLQAIGDRVRLSKERIRQILREAGISKADREILRSHHTDRHVFVGVGVPKEIKDALRAEAARQGVSMSALTVQAFESHVS